MGLYEERFLPRLIDVALGRRFDRTRARVTEGLAGKVLEVGFGTGRNVAHYPAGVTSVLAVEPAGRAWSIAAPRIARTSVPIEFVGLDGQNLPLCDESVDAVLVTWTLCTIPDVQRALHEISRVLRPGGNLHFVEHGRSPQPRSSRLQDRLDPLWGRVAGGCHLNRAIPDLIDGAGLHMSRMRTFEVALMGPLGWMFEGVATKTK